MSARLTIENPAYFDRLAEIETRHWWSRGMWQLASYQLDRALAGQAGLRALDIGCGTGRTMLRIAARREIIEVVGLDPSPDALAHSRLRHEFPLIQGSALDLPFESGRFEIITCFDVMQHLPSGGDRVAASEIHRVLAPGGVAITRSNGRGWTGGTSAYRLEDLCRVFVETGFTIRSATYANALPAIVQEARGMLRRHALGRQNTSRFTGHPSGGGLQIRVPHPVVNRLMGFVTECEAWVAGRAGVRLPFGHSTLVCVERSG